MLQGLRLAFQIDLGVAVGCPEGGVSQPCADRVDIDADAEEVHGRGMTHGVRVDALVVADVKAREFPAIRFCPGGCLPVDLAMVVSFRP